LPLRNKPAACGPLVAQGNNLWCFHGITDGNGNLQPQRALLRLKPAGKALAEIPRE
jgi:hypothetical protein